MRGWIGEFVDTYTLIVEEMKWHEVSSWKMFGFHDLTHTYSLSCTLFDLPHRNIWSKLVNKINF